MAYSRYQPHCQPTEICETPEQLASYLCEPTWHLVKYCPIGCGCAGTVGRVCGQDEDEYFCDACLSSDNCLDIRFDEFGEPVTTGGIESNILSTLAIKKRVLPDPDRDACDVPCDECNDYGGWWYESFVDYEFGSRTWSLEGRQATNDTRLELEQILLEDLQWMVDRGQVSRFEINSSLDPCGTICVNYIDAYPPVGPRPYSTPEIECLWTVAGVPREKITVEPLGLLLSLTKEAA